MRVYVEHDMTVCHVSQVIELKAGALVESPLADYLVESGCDVTIESDDRPAAAPAPTPVDTGGSTGEQSHTPGAAEHEQAGQPEGAEVPAEPGAAE
ncbi:MAG: hypothetical protein HOW97_17115 [Catenulispora sp.]|nr:hypothetical protein [Catenulispora sp.]